VVVVRQGFKLVLILALAVAVQVACYLALV
jgi:hypothetical protein